MKKTKIVIPQSIADATATWLFENEVRVLLSYSTSEFFDDNKINIICAIPEDKANLFQTQFQKYIKA